MKQWAQFWALAMIWGSSFLLIKVAVDEVGAFPLVTVRLGVAAIIFLVYMMATGRKFPSARKDQLALLFVGIFNTAVPFFLISWGETQIDSGLATVLNSTVPLSTLIIAHFALADEKLNRAKITGLAVGFLGVFVLTSRSIGESSGSLLGQGAVLLGSASYAVAVNVLRLRLRHMDQYAVAGWSVVIGAVAIVAMTLLTVHPLPDPADISAVAILAMLTLGVVNTVVAYFLFYRLIREWGVRASLVTYAMPPIGVTLGFVVLGEDIDWRLIVGAGLILCGIVVAKTQKPLTLLLPVRTRLAGLLGLGRS
ncbi:MAG: DMT family transporter [Chloroflexi bacterium]|nr:DMT family transporter [Chloroflexota bacterium]